MARRTVCPIVHSLRRAVSSSSRASSGSSRDETRRVCFNMPFPFVVGGPLRAAEQCVEASERRRSSKRA